MIAQGIRLDLLAGAGVLRRSRESKRAEAAVLAEVARRRRAKAQRP